MERIPPGAKLSIDVTPQPARFDEIVTIRLRDLQPGQPLILRASMQDERARTWTSCATFVANGQGSVNLAADAPITGSYSGVDPMGLFWSATTQQSRRGVFLKRGNEPLCMELTAEIDGVAIASTIVQRHIIAPGVERVPLRERGLVGVFFRPPTTTQRPAVLVFGGAEGDLHEGRAALLASWGYPALALAYFGMEQLPGELANIPLEYFETALTWLGEQKGVDRERLALLGTSRGGEAALLLGVTLPQVRAVIAVVPSSLIWESESASGYYPAWTHHGQGIPCLRWPSSDPAAELSEQDMQTYLAAQPTAAAQATIPVERLRGPLLLISATADRIWPTHAFCENILARLHETCHPFPSHHVVYQDAGHLFTLPHLPTTLTWHGGSAAAMAHANADYWHQIHTFLDATFLS